MRDGFHDLALRCTEAAAQTCHVTELLSRTDGGVAANPERGAAAVRNAMARRGIGAEVLPGLLPETFRVRQTAPAYRQGVDHRPDLRGARLCRDLHQHLAGGKPRTGTSRSVCIDNIPDSEQGYRKFRPRARRQDRRDAAAVQLVAVQQCCRGRLGRRVPVVSQ